MISYEDILEAQERLRPVVRPTSTSERDAVSAVAGRRILLKDEFLQRTGSYKIRGAYNHISRLGPDTEVVAASAGNHAQGVALAARLTNRKATIFMPVSAPWPKIEATRNYGAEVRLEGNVVDDSLTAAQVYAEQVGAVYVPPFDDPLVIAGQGTVGIEVLEQGPETKIIVVPVGGGGLISGIAVAAKTLRPDVQIIGVEAAGAASMVESLRSKALTPLAGVQTMADGIATRSVSQLTLDHVEKYVDDVITVTEDEISRAVVLLLERAKAVVEPAGAVGLAAILAGKIPGDDVVTTILSGGNIDPLLMMRLIDFGLSAAGRYLIMRVLLSDRPGQLALVSKSLGDMRLNVIDVEYHRTGPALGVNEVDIMITVETHGPEHAEHVLNEMRLAGFSVEPVRS